MAKPEYRLDTTSPIEGDEVMQEGQCSRVATFLEQTGLAKKKSDPLCLATSKWFFVKHTGFNDIEILEGSDGKGELAYYIDVKAKFVGWDVTLRKGGKNGKPLLVMRKDITFARLLGWDKGTAVEIKEGTGSSPIVSASIESGSSSFLTRLKKTRKSLEGRQKIEGEPEAKEEVIVPDMDDKAIAELSDKEVLELPAKKVTTLTRKHAFKSNENVFDFNGRNYAWNYWVLLGSTLKLTDVETQEELAVVQLLPTWKWQMITSWSWRLNGTLEIKDEGIRRGMQDIILATLTAMLEWRKHNNKVWIIAAAIA